MDELLRTAMERLDSLWAQALAVWISGGWCMPPIALTALIMFGLGTHVHLKLREKGFQSVGERTWRRWIADPAGRRGPIGEMLDFAMGARSLKDIGTRFEELRATELVSFDRDLTVMKVCVGAAPLLGLLGTVTGMLATFQALASGGGGQKTMAMIAAGISEALITTETGLVVALPGLFFQYHLARKYERYRSFLAHLETVCTKELYARLKHRAAA